MRTLKKVLALSLVFAMAFTMMAGAAFKDQDKIDSELTNDIQLLTALGVFKGDENGNFNPADNVKRSEAAKMIYVLKNNGVDDGAVAFQGVSNYSDVPVGHWAEGYINYCTNLGYMGGWSENGVQKFDPNGNVTGVELMKMLLCMIGYKADVQGYTGNGWQTNVLVDAATSGLSVEFTPSVYGATPRQWTARLMVNAINANWISYSRGEVVIAASTYGEQYLKLYSETGVLTSTKTNALADTAANTVLTDNKYSVINVTKTNNNQTTTTPVQFDYDAPNSLLGQEVRVYFRGNSLTENVLDTDNKVYGVVASGNEKVVETTIDGVVFDSKFDAGTKQQLGKGGKVTVEGLGTKNYDGSEKIEVYVNYDKKRTGDGPDAVLTYKMTELKLSGLLGGNSTLPVKLVADSKGMIKKVMITGIPVYGVVSKLDAENGIFELKNGVEATSTTVKLNGLDNKAISFNKANSENFDKYLNVASDVKVGDVVQCMGTVDGGLKYTVTKATVLGAATGYSIDGSVFKTIKVDGADYKLAAIAMDGYNWNTSGNAGTDKTFYTDGKYVIFSTGSEAVIGVDNLAYLINVGLKGNIYGETKTVYKVMTSDGTISEYEVNTKDNGTGSDGVNDADSSNKASYIDQVYSYTLNGDSKITLTKLKDETKGGITFVNNGGTGTYQKATASMKYSSASYRVDENTVFFAKKTNSSGTTEYVVLKGNEIADAQQAGAQYAHKNVNGYQTMVYGVLVSVSSATTTTPYAVAGAASYVGKVDNNYVNTMDVYTNDGNSTTISWKYETESAARSALNELATFKNKVIEYTLEDSFVKDAKVLEVAKSQNAFKDDTWNYGALKAYDGTTAVVDGTFAKVASDVKIIYVDQDDKTLKASENQDVALANEILNGEGEGTGNYNKNVIVKVSVDGNGVITITDIIVETDGDAIASDAVKVEA